MKNLHHTETCPVRDVLGRLGDKWSMLVLLTLNINGKLRFKEVRQTIDDISQRMLTETLKRLETDGLIERTAYSEIPPKVEYNLTELGKSLMPHIESLVQWAQENMETIIAKRNATCRHDKQEEEQ